MLTELFKKFSDLCSGNHNPCPRCDLFFRLTGCAPASPAENLVMELMGKRQAVSVHWLEKQVSRALYDEQLKKGAYVLDIGIAGPSLFCGETRQVLDQISPDFGSFVHGKADA